MVSRITPKELTEAYREVRKCYNRWKTFKKETRSNLPRNEIDQNLTGLKNNINDQMKLLTDLMESNKELHNILDDELKIIDGDEGAGS